MTSGRKKKEPSNLIEWLFNNYGQKYLEFPAIFQRDKDSTQSSPRILAGLKIVTKLDAGIFFSPQDPIFK